MTETKTEATLSLTHHAEAPIERVFRALTDASELKRWFGPESMVIKSAEMDARVGGANRIEMQSPDGEIYTVKGDPGAERARYDSLHLVVGRGR